MAAGIFLSGCGASERVMTPSEIAAQQGNSPTDPQTNPTVAPTILPTVTPSPEATSKLVGKIIEKQSGKPLSGVIVMVKNAEGTVVSSTSTNGNGDYTLAAVPGTYLLEFYKRPYVTLKYPGFFMADNQTQTRNHEMVPSASIWGFVYYSKAGNSGVEGVKCLLKDGNTVISEVRSEKDGFYGFDLPEITGSKNYTVEYSIEKGGDFYIGSSSAPSNSQPANFDSNVTQLLELQRVSYIANTFTMTGNFYNSSAWANSIFAAGFPRPGVQVSFVFIAFGGDKNNIIQLPVTSQTEAGAFVINIPKGKINQPGIYKIWVGDPNEDPEPANISINITPGVDFNSDIYMIKPTTLAGFVVDAESQTLLPNMSVALYDAVSGIPIMGKYKDEISVNLSETTNAIESMYSNPLGLLVNFNFLYTSHNISADRTYKVVIFDKNRVYSPNVQTMAFNELQINELSQHPQINMQKRAKLEDLELSITGLARDKDGKNLPEGTIISLYKLTGPENQQLIPIAKTTLTNDLIRNFVFTIKNPAADDYYAYTFSDATKQRFAVCLGEEDAPNINAATVVISGIDYTEKIDLGVIVLNSLEDLPTP